MDSEISLDVVTKALISLNRKEFNDHRLTDFLSIFSELEPTKQEILTKVVLGKNLTYKQLLDHIRKNFYIKKQRDSEGKFSALGFGTSETNVTTWSDWGEPKNHSQTNPNPNSNYLNQFVCTWCDINKKGFDDFTSKSIIYK